MSGENVCLESKIEARKLVIQTLIDIVEVLAKQAETENVVIVLFSHQNDQARVFPGCYWWARGSGGGIETFSLEEAKLASQTKGVLYTVLSAFFEGKARGWKSGHHVRIV